MLENENISSVYARFNDIINALKGLGKVYTNHELVSKILKCLPKSGEPKVTAIEEEKDLSTLPLEDLLGSLMTHELRMNDQARNEPKKKAIALKVSKDEESDEDEMALLTKRIRRILLDKKNFSKKQSKKFQSKGDSSKSDKDEKEVICYECNKSGHIRPDCPKLKKKKDKKKAMIATWSDSDDSSLDKDENEEIANITFMAMEDENEVCSSSLSYNDPQNEYNELIDVLDDLNREYQLLKKFAKDRAKENVELKNHILEMKNDECLVEKNSALEKENLELKIEIDALKKTFSKFADSSNKLDKVLGMQRGVYDKTV
ncbi:zf-CCHC domain-containing protein/UBN2 domain-containing protein [Cephalotus follicularis]|uniref:Zf-CCHC domain-containing protein/UBN2 domain-containing protein n=1 Tax=Cephalotus follicularis TaxID=3775 RepID=A0A1Q3BRD3_CEPFO|nr:zf-CCHC domain-containing protein/UBN2 domain-containing protein [Cephalotus follicularis]